MGVAMVDVRDRICVAVVDLLGSLEEKIGCSYAGVMFPGGALVERLIAEGSFERFSADRAPAWKAGESKFIEAINRLRGD